MLDDQTVTMTCGNGHDFGVTLGVARTSPTLACPECGAVINVEAADLDAQLSGIDRAWDDMDETMKNLGR